MVAPSRRLPARGWAFLTAVAALWLWAESSNLPYWRDEENYSYGWVVPGLALWFAWRRLREMSPPEIPTPPSGVRGGRSLRWLLAVGAVIVFPLEVYRVEYHQSGWVLWMVNLAAAAATVAGAFWLGGPTLQRAIRFPALFALTAAPWPAVITSRFQQTLMSWVAAAAGETLLWSDVPVRINGSVLMLDKGAVGIVEACSGIRSLQSGFMVSLAVGELLGLTSVRRWWLVASGAALALVGNFARTMVLCAKMEEGGPELMHRWHDKVGAIAMYSLFAAIYALGWWWEPKAASPPRAGAPPGGRAARWLPHLRWEDLPDLRPVACVGFAAVVAVHGWYRYLEATAHPQSAPSFVARLGSGDGNQKLTIEPDVWARLGPTSGEELRRVTPDAPSGYVEAFHFFWRPSTMSRLALSHRPDVCMPGSGWTQEGPVETLQLEIDGRSGRWFVFRFRREGMEALQLWGAWRNGLAVNLDYHRRLTAQPEAYGPLPTARHFLSVELVSVFVPHPPGKPPTTASLTRLAGQLFQWRPPTYDP